MGRQVPTSGAGKVRQSKKLASAAFALAETKLKRTLRRASSVSGSLAGMLFASLHPCTRQYPSLPHSERALSTSAAGASEGYTSTKCIPAPGEDGVASPPSVVWFTISVVMLRTASPPCMRVGSGLAVATVSAVSCKRSGSGSPQCTADRPWVRDQGPARRRSPVRSASRSPG